MFNKSDHLNYFLNFKVLLSQKASNYEKLIRSLESQNFNIYLFFEEGFKTLFEEIIPLSVNLFLY